MIEFSEVQTYGWVLNTIGFVGCLVLLLLGWRFFAKKVYMFLLIPFVLLAVFFMMFRLETRIDAAGIHYRMFPAELHETTIPWGRVDRLQVRSYILQSRTTQKYNTYSIFDKYGLYITLNSGDGRVVVLGTKKPEELKKQVMLITRSMRR